MERFIFFLIEYLKPLQKSVGCLSTCNGSRIDEKGDGCVTIVA